MRCGDKAFKRLLYFTHRRLYYAARLSALWLAAAGAAGLVADGLVISCSRLPLAARLAPLRCACRLPDH